MQCRKWVFHYVSSPKVEANELKSHDRLSLRLFSRCLLRQPRLWLHEEAPGIFADTPRPVLKGSDRRGPCRELYYILLYSRDCLPPCSALFLVCFFFFVLSRFVQLVCVCVDSVRNEDGGAEVRPLFIHLWYTCVSRWCHTDEATSGPAPTSFLSLRMTPNEYPPLFNTKGGATLFLMCRLFITHFPFFFFFWKTENVNRRWQKKGKKKHILLLNAERVRRVACRPAVIHIHLFAGGGGGGGLFWQTDGESALDV